MNKDKFIVLGRGNTGNSNALLITNLIAASMSIEPVKLKECHKTEEQKSSETLFKLRKGLGEKTIEEYLLIRRKESNLSRAKRDRIVSRVNYYIKNGILTQEEIDSLKLK